MMVKYQILVAAVWSGHVNSYEIMTFGETSYGVFKKGEAVKFCEISLDKCFEKQGNNYIVSNMNLKSVMEQAIHEEMYNN